MTDFSRSFFYATSCVSYVISGVLIFLVIMASPKSMQNFAVLVFDAAVGDLILASFDAIAEVSLVPIGYSTVVTFGGVCSYISDFFCFLCYEVIFIAFYHLVILSLFSFYYRFHSIKFGAMKRSTVILVCIVMWIGIGSFSFVLLLSLSAPHEETEVSLKRHYPNRNYSSFYGIGYESKNMNGSILIVGLLFYVTITNCIMYVLRRKTQLLFKADQIHMSVTTTQMHRQLMKVLTIQSAIPWALSSALFSFSIHMFYIHESAFLDHFPFIITAFLPIFNSIVSIMFIGPYRRRLLAMLNIFNSSSSIFGPKLQPSAIVQSYMVASVETVFF